MTGCGKACAGVMVCGAMDSDGIQLSMLFMETELGKRSGWLNMGRDKQGLVVDSGR